MPDFIEKLLPIRYHPMIVLFDQVKIQNPYNKIFADE
jgi:hypothetical protein